jgi:hypothetical protein
MIINKRLSWGQWSYTLKIQLLTISIEKTKINFYRSIVCSLVMFRRYLYNNVVLAMTMPIYSGQGWRHSARPEGECSMSFNPDHYMA